MSRHPYTYGSRSATAEVRALVSDTRKQLTMPALDISDSERVAALAFYAGVILATGGLTLAAIIIGG